jgi:hypothetical protein
VHELGRKALAALAAGDSSTVTRHMAEMRSQSEKVQHQLDAFARDYPTTFTQQAA